MKKVKTFKRTIFVFIAVIFFSLCLGSCSSGNKLTEEDFKDLIITLERAACFGTCPVYTLAIYGDGTVVYEGINCVKTMGRVESVISQEKIEEIVLEFEKANYFSLNNNYIERNMTDVQSVITSITMGGRAKTIEHYHGDFSAPETLTRLEDKIDEIVNSNQWIE